MPNLIFKVKNYTNDDVITNIVDYILKSSYLENDGSIGCYLLSGYDVAEMADNAFTAAKNAAGRTGGQLVQHIIVGFGDMERIYESEVCRVANTIANYYGCQGYQVFWGSHYGSDRNDSYRHVHIVLNTINAITGKRFYVTHDNMKALKKFLIQTFPLLYWQYEISESFFCRI